MTSRSSTGKVTYRNNNTNNNNGYNANNNTNTNEIPPQYPEYEKTFFPENIKKIKDTRVALRGVVPSEIGNIIGYKKVKEEKKKRAQNEKKHRNNVIKKKENGGMSRRFAVFLTLVLCISVHGDHDFARAIGVRLHRGGRAIR